MGSSVYWCCRQVKARRISACVIVLAIVAGPGLKFGAGGLELWCRPWPLGRLCFNLGS